VESGTEGPDNQSGKDDPEGGATILRFPRDWFGPPEELVPFGPRAAGQVMAEREGSGPPEGAPEEPDADPGSTPADAFWTEEAAAVHDAVDAAEPFGIGGPPRAVLTRRRNLLIASCSVGLLVLVATQVFQGGGGLPARSSRASAAVYVHPWTAISHPPVSRRTAPSPRRGPHRTPAPTRGRETNPVTAQSASSNSPPQSEPAAVPADAPATSSAETAQSSGPSHTDASAASAKSSSSQPAFGANGALGPGSSPNS